MDRSGGPGAPRLGRRWLGRPPAPQPGPLAPLVTRELEGHGDRHAVQLGESAEDLDYFWCVVAPVVLDEHRLWNVGEDERESEEIVVGAPALPEPFAKQLDAPQDIGQVQGLFALQAGSACARAVSCSRRACKRSANSRTSRRFEVLARWRDS